ncbi:hypothetical protein ACHAWF_007522 [Thalassiosira exigua]
MAATTTATATEPREEGRPPRPLRRRSSGSHGEGDGDDERLSRGRLLRALRRRTRRLLKKEAEPAVWLALAGCACVAPFLYHARHAHPTTKSVQLYAPPSFESLLSPSRASLGRRGLSLDLGNGACKWQPPVYDVPEDVDFHKTVIAGFPSGDKRMIFVQMEALTGWPAKDEWDFEFLGMSNHPFIKANYPHHEGIWGWEDAADQVVMMVRNIRRSMVEFTDVLLGRVGVADHDILWDIGYAKTWEEATLNLDQLYSERPPIEDFLIWRDMRVVEECHWYGWFIDYYMEGGLMRDIFTHKITTPEHWYMLMMPTVYSRAELDYDLVVGPDTVVSPSYDPHCELDITNGCEPVAVISAEKLRDYTEGPAETTKIAQVLHNDERTGRFVISSMAWDCIWSELIEKGKGLKTVYDRPGFVEEDYNFSAEMLGEMIHELDRLITKYGGPDWSGKETADRVVELLVEHRGLIQVELNEVNAGLRKLSDKDFLGPKERERRRLTKAKEIEGETKSAETDSGRKLMVRGEDHPTYTSDHSRFYFDTLQKLLEKNRIQDRRQDIFGKKRREKRRLARRTARRGKP